MTIAGIPLYNAVFDDTGRIVDPGIVDRVRIYTEGFAAFVQQRRRERP